MKKFFTFFAAALLSVSMFGKTVREDIPLNLETWGWGYNCQVSLTEAGALDCMTTAEWGAVATGWNDPTRDLSEWDRIVIVVDWMNGCDGEWFKLKGYLRDITHKDDEAGQLEGQIDKEADDFAQNELVIDLTQGSNGCDLTKAGVLAIQCQPNGGIFTISRVYLEKEEGEPQVQTDETVIYVAFPSANRPENIEVAGTFEAGAWGMRVYNGDWYTCNEDLFTSEEDVLKFRDADNHDMILCQRIPANGEGEDKWVQLLLKCSDFEVVSWKGEMARVIDEQNFFDSTNYAWMEGMPEPEPEPEEGIENVVLTEKAQKIVVDGVLYIVRDGKMYNVQGAQVK